MTLVMLSQGEAIALDYLVGRDVPEDLVLRLFTNDVVDGLTAGQVEALTEADFDEATFAGYAAVSLAGGSWSTVGGDPSVAWFPVQEFTSSADQAPEPLYGYFYTRSGGGEAIAFEYFDPVNRTPAVIEFVGQFVRVRPRITCRDTQD